MVLALLTVAAAASACTAPAGPDDAAEPTLPAEHPTVVQPSTASTEMFVVPAFDGPRPEPVADGTVHRYENPRRGAVGAPAPDYRWLEYTLPPGWEVGDVYIGKHLGQPDEVALSFWTTAGVYPDPCRRDEKLSPHDLADHDHPDGASISLAHYPELGLSAQHDREASEPRTVVIADPTEEDGTLAVRFELTVPADLDIATCDEGAYRAWPGYDVPNDNHVAGQTDIVLLVDVDRSPLTIDASFRPESSAQDVRELCSVLGSIVMDRW
ncbi:hypothetical protein ASD16_02830 [Cellulomonas sp. Root485]|uniref:hypothetical protein n=1 Tax=Cellulomonas sp. Root485 TaxID=1736546 RepID=UPI0006FF3C8B|nr:hypothetical protein [Cellulomonas sp. Root485]KQY24486.1 hypothetical protein ASD16_02830 [Cellulomonas sp. Root485]